FALTATPTTRLSALSLHDALPIWILFHHEKRSLRDACVDGEKRPVLQEVHGIVAPFPGPDLASIDCQYLHQFAAVKSHDRLNGTDRKSTRLNSSHVKSSYAVVC